jgi:hypothetical protein
VTLQATVTPAGVSSVTFCDSDTVRVAVVNPAAESTA